MKINLSIIVLSAVLVAINTECIMADDGEITHVGPTITCPPVSDLVLTSNRYWASKDATFRNFDISVSNQIDGFLGAQWEGTNIGRIACVYKPHPPEVFLITLLYNDLAFLPTGKNWKATNNGRWYNCKSNNIIACPFSIRAKPPKENLYNEALQLKQTANVHDDTPEF